MEKNQNNFVVSKDPHSGTIRYFRKSLKRPRDMENLPLVDYDEFIGRMIRQHRRTYGLTARALGEKTGIPFRQLQKFERGQRVPTHRLHMIANALETTVYELCGGDCGDLLLWNGINRYGEHEDFEAMTQEEAEEKMEEKFNEQCQEAYEPDGTVINDEATIYFGFSYLDCHVAIKRVDMDLQFNNWIEE